MFCRRARSFISLALDGALPADRTITLTRHLEGCARCREYQTDLQLGRRLLATSAPALADGFEWRLQLRLNRTLQEAARAAASAWDAPPAGAGRWLRGAGLAAVGGLALAAAVGLFLLPGEWSVPAPREPGVPGALVERNAPQEPAPASAPQIAIVEAPATVTSTAGDPTRTSVSGQSRTTWFGREGTGRAVDLRLSGAPDPRGLLERQGWSGGSLEDLRSIATLRDQNRRLRDALAQAQREVILLRAQSDTARGGLAADAGGQREAPQTR